MATPQRPQKIILTTETMAPADLAQRLGIVSADCAYGLNVFKDIMVSARDLVGGRSEVLQKAIRESRAIVMKELENEARELGADMVIAISLSYTEISKLGSVILVTATGTAIRLGKL